MNKKIVIPAAIITTGSLIALAVINIAKQYHRDRSELIDIALKKHEQLESIISSIRRYKTEPSHITELRQQAQLFNAKYRTDHDLALLFDRVTEYDSEYQDKLTELLLHCDWAEEYFGTSASDGFIDDTYENIEAFIENCSSIIKQSEKMFRELKRSFLAVQWGYTGIVQLGTYHDKQQA